MDRATIDRRLAQIHRGRRWIVPADVAASTSEVVAALRTWGASDILLVVASDGVGDIPTDTVIHRLHLDPGNTIMDGIRRFQAALADPSSELMSAIDAFDPAGDALVVASPFDVGERLLGRRMYGARKPSWAALEDKTVIDGLWDRAGVARAPREVVPLGQAPAASERIGGSFGSVWAIDNSQGWHGGGDGTRWVPDTDTAHRLVGELAGMTEQVRVMPFLDGIPCSIHGFATGAGVAVFRPIELVVFRTPDHGLRYGGVSGLWDAPSDLTREMRAVGAAVGAVLESEYGYLGPYSVDGVATDAGFRPTELNPRLSVGFGMQTAAVEGLAAGALTRALCEGDIEVGAVWLEKTVLEAAALDRRGRMGLVVSDQVEPATTGMAFDGCVARAVAVEHPDAVADLSIGPAVSGSYLLMRFRPDGFPAGELLAPYAASAAAVGAEMWGFELPELLPAPDLSSR
jgi:hypothetical protein